jgi:hypothetical protein
MLILEVACKNYSSIMLLLSMKRSRYRSKLILPKISMTRNHKVCFFKDSKTYVLDEEDENAEEEDDEEGDEGENEDDEDDE